MIEAIFERDLPEQVRLARRNGLKDLLVTYPRIGGSERMLLRKMSRVLFERDLEKARACWSRIEPMSASQEQALDLGTDEFQNLHGKATSFLENEGTNEALEQMIRLYREPESPRGPGYRWNDEHQKSQRETRSLDRLGRTGIRISVPFGQIDVLRNYLQTRPEVSLIESAKNERITTINGFSGSLMTLVIHDSFDHYYVANLLRESGVEGRYSDFFDSVGDPANTDLFSREGELIASPAYAYRLWEMVEGGIEPTFTAERIRNLIRKNPDPTANQADAVQHLEQNVMPDKELSRKYGYITTSVIIELLEQRRKQGFIRILDKDHNIAGNLSLTDPEYLSLIVDITRKLAENHDSGFAAASNIAIMIEEYFRHICVAGSAIGDLESYPPNLQGRVIPTEKELTPVLVMKLADMDDNTIAAKSTLPEGVMRWVINNPAFTATQQPLMN